MATRRPRLTADDRRLLGAFAAVREALRPQRPEAIELRCHPGDARFWSDVWNVPHYGRVILDRAMERGVCWAIRAGYAKTEAFRMPRAQPPAGADREQG